MVITKLAAVPSRMSYLGLEGWGDGVRGKRHRVDQLGLEGEGHTSQVPGKMYLQKDLCGH